MGMLRRVFCSEVWEDERAGIRRCCVDKEMKAGDEGEGRGSMARNIPYRPTSSWFQPQGMNPRLCNTVML